MTIDTKKLRALADAVRSAFGPDSGALLADVIDEIEKLRNQLAAMTTARDEAVGWLMETVAPSIEAERRIAELRKVGQ